jgi:hypothetical protein
MADTPKTPIPVQAAPAPMPDIKLGAGPAPAKEVPSKGSKGMEL